MNQSRSFIRFLTKVRNLYNGRMPFFEEEFEKQKEVKNFSLIYKTYNFSSIRINCNLIREIK